MKAICIEQVGEAPELFLRDIPEPEPGPTDLLVKVRGAALNFADLYRFVSHYGHDTGADHAVAGLEMAGEVIGMGAQVRGFSVGDRVMAMAAKTYAEECLVDYRLVMRVPENLSWEEAAATPVALMTAHNALITNGRLSKGDVVLIEATTSGIGQASAQIAQAFGACHVFGTSGSPEKLVQMDKMGVTRGINTREEDFVAVVQDETDGHGADVTIAQIGGETAGKLINSAAIKGRIINVGRLGKWTGEIDLNEHSAKRIQMIGVTFRTRDVKEHSAVASAAEKDMYPLLASAAYTTRVDRVFPLADADAAQQYMKQNKHFGKIVLTP
ncbi:zinc-binding dehydrogenase [Marivita hallyeonensis]|uniref:NADPH2:quinone reductase n=1 Tax=Marivita hallyeonensis TaxID=996342 RepID=A0A1M5XMU9_9RHOB|nr:zinc-binding dehydrogenase [Marivita hallyeonensis]SHI01086.1 NADPH2:quinone reductase [Marivita hallyeonensis]